MKVNKLVLKIFIFTICLSFTWLSAANHASAWKPKTHVYSANLILEEIRANNGYLVFPYYGKIKVPDEYLNAMQTYPDYFRAGAMGPDAFPDIYAGQVFAHPQTNIAAGDWIKYLMDQMKKLPAGSTESKQALAFILGYSVHASGDLFGHSYVNLWAGGPWPIITDGISSDDRKKIVRHTAVEEYIEKRIPPKYAASAYNSISIPKNFIYNNLVTNGKSPDYSNVSSDTVDINSIYSRTGSLPKHFEMFYDIRNKLKSDIVSRASYSPIRIYEEYWLKDIDEGMVAWIDTSEKIARDLLLPQDGFSKAKEELEDWSTDHFLSMVGFPDVVGTVASAIGSISDLVESVVPDFLKDIIEDMKNCFYDVIFQWAFDMKYTQLKAILDDPSKFLNDTNYFPQGSEAKLNTALGSFTSDTTASSQSLHPFYNTLMMAKLNLIGQQGMDQLLSLNGLQYVGSSSYPPVSFIKSLDVGYNWGDIYFKGLGIWDDQWAREQIFNRIFSAETSKYQWLTNKERLILDAFNNIMSKDPSPDEMSFYSQQMELGWTKNDMENDLRQQLANVALLQQIRLETEIKEERLTQDTTLNRITAGKGRAVYKTLNLNGKKLTVNCNLEITRDGLINVSGGTLVVNGDLIIREKGLIINGVSQGGILNLNGGTVLVHGNIKFDGGLLDTGNGSIFADADMDQMGGLLNVGKGKINIKGTYAISVSGKPAPGATGYYATRYRYSSGYGILQMKETEGRVTVGGNFINTSHNSHEAYLTAGILEVKGDFYQATSVLGCKIDNGIAELELQDSEKVEDADRRNFKAGSLHKVLLSGSKTQNVGFATTGPDDSQFCILEITNPTEIKFVTKVTVSSLFKHNGKKITLSDLQGSSFPDYDGDGQKDNADSTPCPAGQDPSNGSITGYNGTILIEVNTRTPITTPTPTLPLTSDSTGLPTAARTLNAVAGDKMVDLKWNPIVNAAGLDGFYIYRSTMSDGSNAILANDFPIVATSYIDKNIENGKTYFYYIKAVFSDKAGVKSYGVASNIVSASPSQGKGIMVLVIGNPMMKVNNADKEIDPGKSTAPVLVNGKTFVPIRAIIETMGGSVSWVGNEQKLVIVLKDKTIELWINSKATKINGVSKEADVAPYISSSGRTMIPFRYAVENLSCDVIWDGPSKSITISFDASASGDQPDVPPTTPLPDSNEDDPTIPGNTTPADWTGIWNTTFGEVKFDAPVGNTITAHYYNNVGKLTGTLSVSENGEIVLKGTYRDGNDEYSGKGFFEFTLSKDKQSFNGFYRDEDDDPDLQVEWSGDRG